MSGNLAGLVAVITGAGSGIGLATAKRLNADGARIIGLDLVPGELGDIGQWVHCDVGSAESVETAFAEIRSFTDVLHVLVNNAGIGAIGTIEGSSDDEWARVLNVNVVGTARVSRAALPSLRKSEVGGSIINICSIAATVGLPNRAVYSASKGAVLALTMAMAADHVGEGIRVNCITPGTADTEWVGRLLAQSGNPDAERAALEARQPIGRLISPAEVASAVAYLASPGQASTTGITLPVDGGMMGIRLPR